MKALSSSLTTLHQSGLIRPAAGLDSQEYLIRHSLVKDTAYHSMLRSDRKDIHQIVGDVLRRHFPDQEVANVLAQHYEKAEHSELAFKYHLMAADAAYDQYANFEAVDHYERAFEHMNPEALDGEELIRVHRYFGRALELIGDFERTLAVLEGLVALAEDRQDPAMKMIAMIGQARIRATGTPVHDHDRAHALASEALQLARDLGDRSSEVRALWVLQLSELYRESNLDVAEEYGLEALEKARQLGEDRPLALVLTDLARTYMMKGVTEKALELAEEGRQVWQRDGNIVMQADVTTLIGSVSLAAGDPRRSRAALQEAVRLSVEIDNPWGAAAALANAGMADHVQGRPGEALAHLERARRLSTEAEFPAAQLVAEYFGAWVYSDLGAVEEGLQLCRKAMERAREMTPSHRTLILAIWARLNLQNGDIEKARQALEEIDEMQSQSVWRIWIWNPVPLTRLEMLLATEKYAKVVSLSEEHLRDLEAKRSLLFVPKVLCHQSAALIGMGDPEAALVKLHEAERLASEVDLRRDLWRIFVEIGRAQHLLGREEEAERARRKAREEIDHLVDQIRDPALARGFLERPLVADLMSEGDVRT